MKSDRLITTFCLTLCLTAHAAHAFVGCIHNDLKDYGSLTQKVVEYADSGSHRETVDEYAESRDKPKDAVAKSVAATGKLICKGSVSTANLVINGDTILAAGHVLTNPNTCRAESKPSECKFQVDGQPPVPIEGLIKAGYDCPNPTTAAGDWAIMKLKKPIVGVKPYRIRDRVREEMSEAKKVTVVGAYSHDFKRTNAKTKRPELPKHLQDCSVKQLYPRYSPLVIASNCDGSLGKSGGAVLEGDILDPILIGITVGTSATKAELEQERRTGVAIRKPFNPENWFDASVTISGNLYKQLQLIER